MRKISAFAHRHPWPARILLVILHLVLIVLAWRTGSLMRMNHFLLPGFTLGLSLFVFLIAFISYPEKKRRAFSLRKKYYVYQKTCDFFLAAATFGMILSIANRDQPFVPLLTLQGETTSLAPGERGRPTASEILASLKNRDRASLTGSEKRILRRELKKQLKIYAGAKLSGHKKEADASLVIILSIVGAVGLFVLICMLACELSCSGAEGAAVAVFILGTIGIIIGLIAIIRGIRKKHSRNVPPPPSTQQRET